VTQLVRPRSGHSFIELAVGLLVLIPVSLFFVDLGTLVLGVTFNGVVCQNACRAAASGPPEKCEERALAVVKQSVCASGAVKLRQSIDLQTKLNDPLPRAPFGGPYSGEITCATTVDVHPPFMISALVGREGIPVTIRQTFSITYVMPGSFKAGQ